MRKRETHITSDCPGSTITREAHCMDCKPGHQGFLHISLALIVSSADKRGGAVKYIDNYRAGTVKNHNLRLADLWGEVISDVKSGKSFSFLSDVLNKGNYLARAN